MGNNVTYQIDCSKDDNYNLNFPTNGNRYKFINVENPTRYIVSVYKKTNTEIPIFIIPQFSYLSKELPIDITYEFFIVFTYVSTSLESLTDICNITFSDVNMNYNNSNALADIANSLSLQIAESLQTGILCVKTLTFNTGSVSSPFDISDFFETKKANFTKILSFNIIIAGSNTGNYGYLRIDGENYYFNTSLIYQLNINTSFNKPIEFLLYGYGGGIRDSFQINSIII